MLQPTTFSSIAWLFVLLFSASASGQLVGDRQNGLASYYSPEYDGAETAYGVIYDRTELVAAHKTYPLNSTVRVTNESNGNSVVVRIIDKGPFIRGRIVELSERAADELGMLGERTVPVEVQLLSTPDQRPVSTRDVATTRTSNPDPAPVPRATPNEVEPEPESVSLSQPPPQREVKSPQPESPRTTPTPASRPNVPSVKKSFGPGLYQVSLHEPKEGRYGVQVGSFENLERAMDKVAELQGRYFDEILLHKQRSDGGYVYKVLLGTFNDQDSAQHYAASLKQRYAIPGFTTVLPR
ncbi:septal ring lytic transglycosylase RlpA family protein [Lewinella sp. IMCC34191]|uniref:septal ring lytic transglycosylase RlpA family protein n=1 Tax=Lewinella sp. IMCC34191 TaxID=2259172 RepID=UPI0018E598A9|nr:septal ring lytic transglycosylase RlpA family protein [Lewinella sp. IMCC34191]